MVTIGLENTEAIQWLFVWNFIKSSLEETVL
jgi:hypothetical protein